MSRNNIPEAYSGDESYIFVSYHHDDEEIAYEIISDFQARGYRVCYDSGIPIGVNYFESLAEKIRNCELFLCILSTKYIETDFCQRELFYALNLRKRIVPIKTETFKLPDAMQFQLSALHSFNIANYPSGEALVDHLCEIAPQTLKPGDAETANETAHSGEAASAAPKGKNPFSLRDIGSAVLKTAGAVAAAPIAAPVLAGKYIVDKLSAKKEKDQKQPTATDSVNFSVLSPKAVKPDSYGVINLHMYTDVQREVVEQAIRESNGLDNSTFVGKPGSGIRIPLL